jgi:hypothetical protein
MKIEDNLIQIIGYNDSAVPEPLQQNLYEDYCACCGCGIGKRTEGPIIVSFVPRLDVMTVEELEPAVYLVSERMKDILQSGNRELIFRQVAMTKKSPRRIYEIVGPYATDTVAIRGILDSGSSAECRDCGRHKILNFPERGTLSCYAIRASTLPSAECFLSGPHSILPRLCVRSAWWSDVTRQVKLKGVPKTKMLVVGDDGVDTSPVLDPIGGHLYKPGFLSGEHS